MQFVRLEPNQALDEGGWVFSSSGDTNRTTAPHGRNLLNVAVSGAATVAQGLFAALFPSDCRLCGTPLVNISRLPVCTGCLLAITPIATGTCVICGERCETECSLCGNSIPVEELNDGRLCGYCDHMLSKDD